ncbi:MAG: CRTAC1 family protein [Spirochaetaceae bacterium]|nr:CRTAC1 family protein [Spirochaetaceae bacterium]
MLVACAGGYAQAPVVPVDVSAQPFAPSAGACTGAFVAHPLPHITRSNQEELVFFVANGAGVALADLDGDSRIDIALAGMHAPPAVLWNQGGLQFRKEALDVDGSRAVNAVDVDGDGRLDLVFTHAGNRPSLWRLDAGRAEPALRQVPPRQFVGRYNPYSIAWADLDGDTDLDMVGASYNAELMARGFGTPSGGGVFLFTNEGGALKPDLLVSHAQALAVLLTDLDGDGRRDILVGNDFATPDEAFLNKPEGWIDAAPFERTTANTMGFAEGDADNDGRFEIIGIDMKPYQEDPVWTPPLEGKGSMQADDGVQFVANTLQFRRGDPPVFVDEGGARGVDATGWSWSVQFGDLDNDGALDLYVVNGMINEGLFGDLPGDELVEENQALRNDGTGHFTPAPEWGLGATEGGRGMSFADLDNDGDLDVVVNNFAEPSVLFENRLCGGAALQVELHWEGSLNSRAIGALLRLHTSDGRYVREMRASSGYLSSLPARVHFGLGDATGSDVQRLEVIWPDGAASRIDNPPVGSLLEIRRPAAPESAAP